jgi:hypothetical protein
MKEFIKITIIGQIITVLKREKGYFKTFLAPQ